MAAITICSDFGAPKNKVSHFFPSYRTATVGWAVQLSSVSSSVMSDNFEPVDCSMPGFPGHHQLPELTQTHVHRVSDVIQLSSFVIFSSCLQFCPASGSFLISQSFTSGGQSIRVSASASVLPMNIQDWFLLGWTGWISLQSKGHKSLLQHHKLKASILWHSAFFIVQLSHPYMTTGNTIALTRWTFVGKVMSLLFNMLITFLPRSKHLLISWLQSPSAVIFG